MRTTVRPPSNRSRKPLTRRRVGPRTVIVGAGIAGLTIAERLIADGSRKPSDILILEKYDYVGGRIVSHSNGYEIGAGRIHESHHHVISLIDRFHLTRIPLGTTVTWMPLGATEPIPNHFETDLRSIIRRHPIPATEASTMTIRQYLRDYLSADELTTFLDHFPFRAETEILRADLSIQSFRPHSEMGTHADYFVIKEGLSAIIRGLRDNLTAAGVRIRLNTEVRRVDTTGAIHIRGQRRPLCPDRTVLALHASALQRILPPPAVRQIHRFLRMEPLTRIYAAYPPDHPWTQRITSNPAIVTDSPLRYVIPINPSTGIIMISYTEGRDTRKWRGLKGATLQAEIQKEVRRLWLDEDVPEPTWVRSYEWKDGCTYWRTGRYDPHVVASTLQHPYPTVWIAGESLSVGRQAWIEGALEVANQVADRITA